MVPYLRTGFRSSKPAGGRYYFGTPIVEEATLKVRDGEFRILAKDNSSENIYIQSVTLNGQPLTELHHIRADRSGWYQSIRWVPLPTLGRR